MNHLVIYAYDGKGCGSSVVLMFPCGLYCNALQMIVACP